MFAQSRSTCNACYIQKTFEIVLFQRFDGFFSLELLWTEVIFFIEEKRLITYNEKCLVAYTIVNNQGVHHISSSISMGVFFFFVQGSCLGFLMNFKQDEQHQ